MRRALIIALVVLSLMRLDMRRSKSVLRRVLIATCRGVLNLTCHTYEVRECRTMVFAPHQDDETLGCGGLIARKRQEGFPVHVVFLTDGSASHPDHPIHTPDQIASLRKNEARASLARLGVESNSIHFLDERDGTLNQLDEQQQTRLVARLTAVLREVGPEKVFLPYKRDGSTEHDAAFLLINRALRAAELPCEVWQYPVWAWWNPYSLLRLALFGRGCCRLPTEDFGLAKKLALRCYASQTKPLLPWTQPTLPADLLRVCDARAEYFFRHHLTD